MRQRIAIAIAILNDAEVIIADEPTTALDVTIQAQILYEIQRICAEAGTSVVWISHDLGVVAAIADRICVMYAGRIVEEGRAAQVLQAPRHPYRSEEHTSELQSLMRISYAVFCLKKNKRVIQIVSII